ncbi:MAG: Spy/CpxP family protein refolding chaperone [Planctomycetota bacterium]
MCKNTRHAVRGCALLTVASLLCLAGALSGAGEPRDDPPPRRDGGDEPPPRRDGGRGPREGPQKYSLEQAASDQAQLHTIAFNGLAFITGDFGACTFMPPGKVCDFFGFQYMRDIDAAGKGHNPMFLDRVAANVLQTLNDEQRKSFEVLARQQAAQFNDLARRRWPVIKAFCRELKGEVPAGSQGLDKDSVIKYVGGFFAFDAELSYARAQAFGTLATSLSPEQKACFAKMKFGDFNTWPEADMEKYKLPRGTEKMLNVAYMTYASEFFSWYAGSVEADTYFCPERHGTYFGGFYMKDMPAMGKRDYNISTSVTGDSGKAFLEILDEGQRRNLTAIPDLQRKALKEAIEVRRAISTELRKFLKGAQADKEKVLALGRRYGELDGEMSYYYATAFAKANKTLTAEQRKALVKLRNLDGYTSAPAYIYSTPVNEALTLPDTDHFFFPPKKLDGGVK